MLCELVEAYISVDELKYVYMNMRLILKLILFMHVKMYLTCYVYMFISRASWIIEPVCWAVSALVRYTICCMLGQ